MTTGAGGMVIMHQAQDQSQTQYQNARSIWTKVVTGFTSHTFVGNDAIITEFWDTQQNVLHNFTTQHPMAQPLR
jgi:hypothetical protein